MSEKQATWVFVIAGLLFVAFMYLINPWSLLSIPLVIFGTIVIEERSSIIKENKELKVQLAERQDLLDSTRNQLTKSKSNNSGLRSKVRELENEIEKITKDPNEEIRKLELNAEKEILGNA